MLPAPPCLPHRGRCHPAFPASRMTEGVLRRRPVPHPCRRGDSRIARRIRIRSAGHCPALSKEGFAERCSALRVAHAFAFPTHAFAFPAHGEGGIRRSPARRMTDEVSMFRVRPHHRGASGRARLCLPRARGKASRRCQRQKKAVCFYRSGRKNRGSAQARRFFRVPQGGQVASADPPRGG